MIQGRFVTANGLRHHVLASTTAPTRALPALVLHGYLDTAQTFIPVLEGIANAGYRVFAPDFRGHGESDWVPSGGYYHFADYIADVAELLRVLDVPRAHVVAHSMGGSVATLFAGAVPDRVASLALLEGVGPPAMPPEVAPDRTAAWIQALAHPRPRTQRVYPTFDEVLRRMRVSHPDIPMASLRAAAERSVREVPTGGLAFRFDPLHQTTSPGRFDAEGFEAHVARITCPVLMIDGGSYEAYPDLAERAQKYPVTRMLRLDGAGHMMHWTQPAAVVAAVTDFLAEV